MRRLIRNTVMREGAGPTLPPQSRSSAPATLTPQGKTMIDIEEIRKDIAVEHNNLLSKDDPILISVSISERVLSQCVSILNEQNERNQKALLAAVKQGLAEGKVAAKEVVRSGGEYVSDQVHTAIESAINEGREELRKDLRLAWSKIEAARKASYVAAGVSVVCAVVTLGALVGSA